QALLAALCPAGDFRESVLGDLAEEYAERVDRDGVRSARRWYWREATRAAAYAMLAWLRGLGIGEAAQLVAITAATVIVARLFQYSLMWLVVASWGTMADSQG